MAARSRLRKWSVRIASILAGLAVGGAIAEAAFWYRDDGAFPHVNFYVPDAELGVRLEPGATQRIKFRDNPTTEVRVNDAGFRGDGWPARADDDILVVGDSQVFGLGVEEDETFSAQLAELTGRTVLNGGVPTYGPLEYNAVVERILAERSPKTVVYVVNMANDLFETDRPNRDRHAVWDGWAVRSETAPDAITDFPGRELLFRDSHLVYALRRWLWEQGPERDDRGFDSEGTWHDLVDTGTETTSAHASAEETLLRASREQHARLAKLDVAIDDVEDRVDAVVYEQQDEIGYGNGDYGLRYRAARGNPGDIVADEAVEEGRAIVLTAAIIRRGVVYRQSLVDRTLRGRGADAMETALEARERIEEERSRIRSEALQMPHVPSVLEPRLREVRTACEAHGAELVVVALPLDVAVSPEEWEKYGVEPVDMEPTRVLLTDLVRTAERMGARGLDATDALREASPGAFLDGDIHMTPKGHRAVAEALAETLNRPPPLPLPDGRLPEGRTRVPTPDEWLRRPEAIVRGSTRAGCETMRLAEWFRSTCKRQGTRNVPTGVTLVSGGRGEAMMVSTPEASTLVTPLSEGDEVLADFHWVDRTQRLVLRWPDGADAPEMFFEEETGPGRELELTDEARRLCECHIEVEDEKICETQDGWPTGDCTSTCVNLFGDPSAECFAAYRGDCVNLLRCVRGDPLSLPPCQPGFANAGATRQCFRLCSDDRPCDDGDACTPWQGSAICRPQ